MNSLHAVNKPVWDVSTAMHLTEPGLDLGMLQVLSGALGCRGAILKKPFLKLKKKRRFTWFGFFMLREKITMERFHLVLLPGFVSLSLGLQLGNSGWRMHLGCTNSRQRGFLVLVTVCPLEHCDSHLKVLLI